LFTWTPGNWKSSSGEGNSIFSPLAGEIRKRRGFTLSSVLSPQGRGNILVRRHIMSKRVDVEVEVISQNGFCGQGNKVGDKWVIKGKTPEGICISAFCSMMPFLNVMRYAEKDSFPFSKSPDEVTFACPDAANPVVYRLRRLREPVASDASRK
jgi:uncharacterized repeat protein (TIGR04076 family)